METIVTERELPRAFDLAEVRAWDEKTGWCFEAYGITRIRSYLSADGRRLICVLQAPDVESVRQANAKSDFMPKRIYRVSVHRAK